MSEPGSDNELRFSRTTQKESSVGAEKDDTELSTDGAVSLFSTVLTNALEQQKLNIIQHFENRFPKSEKATGVEAAEFVFKHEGNKIQYSFNSERADKLSQIDSLIKLKNFTAASELVAEEKETLRKRNKILKIADKHGWDTVQEYLDSPLADDKDDAANLRTAIARASRKRNSKPYDRSFEKSDNRYSSRGGPKFNARNFFRGFSQINGADNAKGQQAPFGGNCFYCNQPGHYARFCPLKGTVPATITAPKEQPAKPQ